MEIVVTWLAIIGLGVPILYGLFTLINPIVKWGFWPALAELTSYETDQNKVRDRLDDCLVNAVAHQPPGRLRTLLLNDLNTECGYSITAAWLTLYADDADDKSIEKVIDEVAVGHAITKSPMMRTLLRLSHAQPRS